MSIPRHKTGRGYGRLMNDLTGKRFGKLVALKGFRDRGATRWECKCDCGTVTTPLYMNLTTGRTTSCGCGVIEAVTTHGLSKTKEYRAWRCMWDRVTRKTGKAWRNYGSRGITVCKRWEKLENFISDMGPAPSPKHSVDRIDNDKGYSKSNCRWATPIQQRRNRRYRK